MSDAGWWVTDLDDLDDDLDDDGGQSDADDLDGGWPAGAAVLDPDDR